MMKNAQKGRTDIQYLNFDPFAGDRDVRIECYKVALVTTRTPHVCSASYLLETDKGHTIDPGTKAKRETAKVDGTFGTCYQCLPCLDRLMDEAFGI